MKQIKNPQKKLLSILTILNTLKIKKTTSFNNGKIFKAFSIFYQNSHNPPYFYLLFKTLIKTMVTMRFPLIIGQRRNSCIFAKKEDISILTKRKLIIQKKKNLIFFEKKRFFFFFFCMGPPNMVKICY